MNQKKEVVCSNLLNIIQSIVFLMKVNEPGKASRVSSDYVVFSFFGLGRYVASVRNVLYAKGGL